VTNDLFDDGERGMDLIAINMQRGRDHGLPGYIFYREACGSGPIGSFEDFSNNMTPEVSGIFLNSYNHDLETTPNYYLMHIFELCNFKLCTLSVR
jgi:peroxidase